MFWSPCIIRILCIWSTIISGAFFVLFYTWANHHSLLSNLIFLLAWILLEFIVYPLSQPNIHIFATFSLCAWCHLTAQNWLPWSIACCMAVIRFTFCSLRDFFWSVTSNTKYIPPFVHPTWILWFTCHHFLNILDYRFKMLKFIFTSNTMLVCVSLN